MSICTNVVGDVTVLNKATIYMWEHSNWPKGAVTANEPAWTDIKKKTNSQ